MFPAGAGMNRGYKFLGYLSYYVPRRRGDEPLKSKSKSKPKLCSPQARG